MMQRNEKCLSIYLLPALLTPVPLIAFTSEKITCCANETAKSASRNSTKFKSKNPKNPKEIQKTSTNSPSFYFMFYCFSDSIK